MRQLLKQDTNFTWSDECQRELDDLKTALISSPVLHPFRDDRKIYIYVDRSQSGLGSCAVQMGDDGKPHPCSYMSYATTDSQKRWASYQLELAALGMTLRQHESLFLQSQLEVFSDNAVVVNLQKYKPMNNRERRLLAYISQFQLKLRYIPGRLNKVADALSRLPEDIKSSDTIYFQPPEKVKEEEFILAVTEPNADQKDKMEPSDSPTNQTISREWTAYTIEYLPFVPPITENNQNATEIVTPKSISAITNNQPLRRSARIADRAARRLKPESPPSAAETVDTDTTGDVVTPNESDKTPVENDEQTADDLLLDWSASSKINDDEQNAAITAEQIHKMIRKPKITEADYLSDTHFKPIFEYLKYQKLTGNDETDRRTLLIAENYYLEDDLLYKISLPRGRKEKRVRPTYHQLCVPQNQAMTLLQEWHELLGHYSINRLLPTLNIRYYWPKMLTDIKNVSRVCDTCQRSKIITNPAKAPLKPIPIPVRPFQLISFDHKVLARKTLEGNTHILAFVDHFSGWVTYRTVESESAYTTAKIFVKDIVANWGTPEIILTDKAPGYMSVLFHTVSKMLGVRHRSSAALAKRTNGLAELAIRKLNAGLRLYSTDEIDDTWVELLLPLVEMSICATANAESKVSPFSICHGFEMRIPTPTDVEVPSFCSTDSEHYAQWLKNSIKLLHEAVRMNKIESKQEMKNYYDKRNRVKEPHYSVGDLVLVKDTRTGRNSNRILTKKPFLAGPYLVCLLYTSDAADE